MRDSVQRSEQRIVSAFYSPECLLSASFTPLGCAGAHSFARITFLTAAQTAYERVRIEAYETLLTGEPGIAIA